MAEGVEDLRALETRVDAFEGRADGMAVAYIQVEVKRVVLTVC